VHLRISSPPTIGPCRYGIDTPTHGELIANNKTVAQIETYTTADTLAYLSLEGLRRAVGGDGTFCSACFDNQYPIPLEEDETQRELFHIPDLEYSLGKPK
jgi:amidophosphoribosyltransferase